jgi:hypothetical protein
LASSVNKSSDRTTSTTHPRHLRQTTTFPHHPPPNYHIPYHQPSSPTHNQYIPPPPQFGTTNPKSPLANHLQVAPWPPHYRATPSHKYHGNVDPRKFLVLRSCHSFNRGRRSHPRQILNHFPRRCCRKLVFQPPARTHLFLAAVEREVPAQLPRFPGGARLKRRFSVVHSERERNTPQFLLEFFYKRKHKPRRYQMIKSSRKLSKPCVHDRCTVILSESVQKQCRSSTNNSLSLASLRFNTFASLSSREKSQNQTKPQDLAIIGKPAQLPQTRAQHRL